MTLIDVAILAAEKLMQAQAESTKDHYTKCELSYELCRPHMARCLQKPHLKRSVRTLVEHEHHEGPTA